MDTEKMAKAWVDSSISSLDSPRVDTSGTTTVGTTIGTYWKPYDTGGLYTTDGSISISPTFGEDIDLSMVKTITIGGDTYDIEDFVPKGAEKKALKKAKEEAKVFGILKDTDYDKLETIEDLIAAIIVRTEQKTARDITMMIDGAGTPMVGEDKELHPAILNTDPLCNEIIKKYKI